MQTRRTRAFDTPNLAPLGARAGSFSSIALLCALAAACSSAEPSASDRRDTSESVDSDAVDSGAVDSGAVHSECDAEVVDSRVADSEAVSANRVVGYLPVYRETLSYWTSTLDFSALTHVTLAFASLDKGACGVEIHYRQKDAPPRDEPGLEAFVNRVHEKHKKVCLAIGGEAGSDALGAEIVKDPIGLARKVANYAAANHLDCIDVDQEEAEDKRTDELDAAYGNFIRALAPRLHKQKKELTAAVSRWKARKILPIIGEFDFMSPMAYDYNLVWSSKIPVDPSPLAQSEEEMEWWVDNGADPAKLVWGVPFYGFTWKNDGTIAEPIAYRTIIEQLRKEPAEDTVPNGTSTITLNSRGTILEKAKRAKEKYGGVMAWELWQDAPDEQQSLLNAIKNGY